MNMAFLNLFEVVTLDSKPYILLHAFHDYLVANYIEGTDKLKKQYLITQCTSTLTGYGKEKIKVIHQDIEGVNVKRRIVPIAFIVKYIFHQSNFLVACDRLSDIIVRELCQKEKTKENVTPQVKTIKGLYDDISKESFSAISEQAITTDSLYVYGEYKESYSEEQWKKILLFEHHFSKQYKNRGDFDDVLLDKLAFLQQIRETSRVATSILEQSLPVIDTHIQRKKLASAINGVSLNCTQKHLHCIMENDIQEELKAIFPRISYEVVVIDGKSSSTTNSVYLFIECDEDMAKNENFTSVITSALQRKHKVGVEHLVFLQGGVLKNYKKKSGSDTKIQRYKLRNDYFGKQLQQFIVIESETTIVSSANNPPIEQLCRQCFKFTVEMKPLSVENFELFMEWLHEVPLQIQIILSAFLNKDTLKQSKNKQGYLQSKVHKLYSIFDMLLNVHNKKHCGLLQDINTYELILGYRSAETVFDISSRSGTASSYTKAEKSLSLLADDDECYYRSILKPYPYTYHAKDGSIKNTIQMTGCHVTLLIDNLVRLKFRDDPEPGVSRSKQLDMLPITLQGLPKDSATTVDWHDKDICDGTSRCLCKQDRILKKQDLREVLFDKTANEKRLTDMFGSLMNWSFMYLWTEIKTSDVWTSLKEERRGLPQQTCIDTVLDDDSSAAPLEVSKTQLTVSSTENRGEVTRQENGEEMLTDTDTAQHGMGMLQPIPGGSLPISPFSSGCTSLQNIVQQSPLPENTHDTDDDSDGVDEVSRFDLSESEIEWDSDDSWVDNACSEKEAMCNCTENKAQDKSCCNATCMTDMGKNEDNVSKMFDVVNIEHLGKSELENLMRDLGCDNLQEANTPSIIDLEKSFQAIEIIENDQSPDLHTAEAVPLPCQFGFKKYSGPDLHTTHPPAYSGRDDDISVIKKVLDDILQKLGFDDEHLEPDKILLGPDHKIGANIMKLMKQDPKYAAFLLEFPLLHFRKSKITTLFSSYKDAGILEMMQYMIDADCKDWTKLVSAGHIDTATRYIHRLSSGIHLALVLTFFTSLDAEAALKLETDLDSMTAFDISKNWNESLRNFVKEQSEKNATFCLHVDMMDQLDSIVSLALAERLGGEDGYNLMTATAKDSVATGFLSGASAYAPYVVDLLYEHHRVGHYFQKMKECLYSTHIKGSAVNFSTDTRRELEHIDAVKGFRSGSTKESVSKRLAVIDILQQIMLVQKKNNEKGMIDDKLGWRLTANDMKHVLRVASLVLRRGGLSLKKSSTIRNVYGKETNILSDVMLDKNSRNAGEFLAKKYVIKQGLFQFSKSAVPDVTNLQGPKELVSKVIKTKSVTMKKTTLNVVGLERKERDMKEEKRKKTLKKKLSKEEALSSDMNSCQSLVRPDCGKRGTNKATGMSDALFELLLKCLSIEVERYQSKLHSSYLQNAKLVWLEADSLPSDARLNATFASVEFAGFKFKTDAATGKEYCEKAVKAIKMIPQQAKNMKHIVVCEEKYLFTPTIFKAATSENRKKATTSISHLRSAEEMINVKEFHKDSLVGTSVGKSRIGTYFAENAKSLDIRNNIVVDFDSELHVGGCSCKEKCSDKSCNQCELFARPIRCTYTTLGSSECKVLDTIHQRKGEAEMSQVDWLIDAQQNLGKDDVAISFVSSADIDAIVIHLFAISKHWKRDAHGKFLNAVYAVLQKKGGKQDVYCITNIIELLETRFEEPEFACKVAVTLCIGGNDFVPKVHGKTHSKLLKFIFRPSTAYYKTLFDSKSYLVNETEYLEVMKAMYCSKTMNPSELTFDEVRRKTIGMKKSSRSLCFSDKVRNPSDWLPPVSVLQKVLQLINMQVQYLHTAGFHNAPLPDFMSSGCFKVHIDGSIEYDFGPESHLAQEDILELAQVRPGTPKKTKKRKSVESPRKGRLRKKLAPLHSTPVKR